jgi:hypothetical protein
MKDPRTMTPAEAERALITTLNDSEAPYHVKACLAHLLAVNRTVAAYDAQTIADLLRACSGLAAREETWETGAAPKP